jgi:site-specific DNA recombinase
LRTVERRQTELTTELAGASAPAPLIHPNLAEVYRRKVAALHEALREPGSKDEAFELIRSLIEVIRLVPDEGRLRVEIKGELAGILELCREADKTKPGGLSTAGLAEQIKMVAGERNQRYLQALAARIPRIHRPLTAVTGVQIP